MTKANIIASPEIDYLWNGNQVINLVNQKKYRVSLYSCTCPYWKHRRKKGGYCKHQLMYLKKRKAEQEKGIIKINPDSVPKGVLLEKADGEHFGVWVYSWQSGKLLLKNIGHIALINGFYVPTRPNSYLTNGLELQYSAIEFLVKGAGLSLEEVKINWNIKKSKQNKK